MLKIRKKLLVIAGAVALGLAAAGCAAACRIQAELAGSPPADTAGNDDDDDDNDQDDKAPEPASR